MTEQPLIATLQSLVTEKDDCVSISSMDLNKIHNDIQKLNYRKYDQEQIREHRHNKITKIIGFIKQKKIQSSNHFSTLQPEQFDSREPSPYISDLRHIGEDSEGDEKKQQRLNQEKQRRAQVKKFSAIYIDEMYDPAIVKLTKRQIVEALILPPKLRSFYYLTNLENYFT